MVVKKMIKGSKKRRAKKRESVETNSKDSVEGEIKPEEEINDFIDCEVGEVCFKVKPEDEIKDAHVEGFFEVSANKDNASLRYVVKLKDPLHHKIKSISAAFITETREEPHLVVEHVAGTTIRSPGPTAAASFGTHPSNFDIVLWETRPVAVLSGAIAIPVKVPMEGKKRRTCPSFVMHHFTFKRTIDMN